MWSWVHQRLKAIPPETWAAWFVTSVCSIVVIIVGMMLGGVLIELMDRWLGF